MSIIEEKNLFSLYLNDDKEIGVEEDEEDEMEDDEDEDEDDDEEDDSNNLEN